MTDNNQGKQLQRFVIVGIVYKISIHYENSEFELKYEILYITKEICYILEEQWHFNMFLSSTVIVHFNKFIIEMNFEKLNLACELS